MLVNVMRVLAEYMSGKRSCKSACGGRERDYRGVRVLLEAVRVLIEVVGVLVKAKL